MALEVIGAGLGRNATFSTKFALEEIGFGPCYHMAEVFRTASRSIGLWQDVVDGRPDWDAIFDGYRSTTDYPACTYWRELANFYPDAKVVLTVRDPDRWFDSVSETIFAPRMMDSLKGSPVEKFMAGTIFAPFGDNLRDRAFMTDWYQRRNDEVIATISDERLLVFHPKEGWEPLCTFLDADMPDKPFPRVNSRDELGSASDEKGGLPADPAELEAFADGYIAALKAKAFG